MPDKKITDLVDGDPLQPTDEFVVARAGDNFKIDGAAVVAAVTKHDVTLAGNTAGVLALVSSGTLTLAGGNNITLSQVGNAVTLSGAAQSVQPETQTFIGGISASDTLYTSGTVRFTGVGGGVTVASNTGQRVDISVAAQSVQPETQTFIGGISASDTLYTSGTVRFTGVGGGITVSTNTGQRIDLSVAAQSVQPETQTFVGGIGNSQTTYTSGTVNLSVVAGNLTIRSTTGQAFQFSMSQSPETQTAISGIANSQTTYTSGTVSLSELGAITIRSTTGNQFQFSVNAQTTQTQGILNVGVSTGGNTSGDTTVNTGTRLVLAGGNNITLSQGTAAGATTITISAGAGGGATFSGGMSTAGNTSGDTGFATNRLALVGGNNITLSGSTDAGSMTITVSAPNLGAGAMSAGVSNLGNTAGSTGVTGTRLVLVGTNDLTLSQSTDANGGTVTFVPRVETTLSYFDAYANLPIVYGNGPGQATLHIQPYVLPQPVAFDRMVGGIQISNASNSSFSQTISFWLGIYTKNSSTLSLSTSASFSTNFSASGTVGSYSLYGGPRDFTVGLTHTLSQGNYYFGLISRSTTGGGAGASYNLAARSNVNSNYSGILGAGSNATDQMTLGLGVFSASTSGMPASVPLSQIQGTASQVLRLPVLYLHSGTV